MTLILRKSNSILNDIEVTIPSCKIKLAPIYIYWIYFFWKKSTDNRKARQLPRKTPVCHLYSIWSKTLMHEYHALLLIFFQSSTNILCYIFCIIWNTQQTSSCKSSTVEAVFPFPVIRKTFFGHSNVTEKVVVVLYMRK